MTARDGRTRVAIVTAVALLAVLAIGAGITGGVAGFESFDETRSADFTTESADSTTDPVVTSGESPATIYSSLSTPFESTRLSGTVTDEDGEPIFQATVSVNGTERETTRFDGFYSLELEPGEYELTVDAEGYETETWAENLSEGEWARTDVTLERAPSELEGTVTDGDEPIENATVVVLETGNETTTDENGAYEFELEAGEYTLETSAENHSTRRSTVSIGENEQVTRDVRLPPIEPDEEEVDEVDEDPEDEPEAVPEDDDPLTNLEQVLRMLFIAGTFLTVLLVAASVGLYRDRLEN